MEDIVTANVCVCEQVDPNLIVYITIEIPRKPLVRHQIDDYQGN